MKRLSQSGLPLRSITSLRHLYNRIVCFRWQLNVIKRESPAELSEELQIRSTFFKVARDDHSRSSIASDLHISFYAG